jgi:hypothetical protein
MTLGPRAKECHPCGDVLGMNFSELVLIGVMVVVIFGATRIFVSCESFF